MRSVLSNLVNVVALASCLLPVTAEAQASGARLPKVQKPRPAISPNFLAGIAFEQRPPSIRDSGSILRAERAVPAQISKKQTSLRNDPIGRIISAKIPRLR